MYIYIFDSPITPLYVLLDTQLNHRNHYLHHKTINIMRYLYEL
jgi:hypothetical protein